MESLTTWYFRQLHHEFFPGVDRYFTPFLSANQNFTFQSREQDEIAPGNNPGIQLVPQIMTNRAEEFVWAVQTICPLGYPEINLNLGCPASQVVNRKKGAGFLENPEALDRFFEETFAELDKLKISAQISVKTRIGYHSPEEADGLLRIYNRYPLSEVIIHPRTRKEYYQGTPHREVFRKMLEESRHPVCYNGNIFTVQDYQDLLQEFPVSRYPMFHAVMLGRGLLSDPALVREILASNLRTDCVSPDIPADGTSASAIPTRKTADSGEDTAFCKNSRLTKEECRAFTTALLRKYQSVIDGGDHNILSKMKEIWTYLGTSFTGSDGDPRTAERAVKEIHKSRTLSEYRIAAENLFASCRIK